MLDSIYTAAGRCRLVTCVAIAVLAAGGLCCRHSAPLASAIPADAIVLASVDLGPLRAAPIAARLPEAARQNLETYRTASRLIFAWKPDSLLVLAAGAFRTAPAGATLASPNLAIAGTEDAVRAAIARSRSHANPSALLQYAEQAAAGAPVWIAARGGVTLPLTGNAANVNRLLRRLEFGSLSVTLDSPARIRFTGLAVTGADAAQSEETLRAFFSLAAAGEAHQAELAALFQAVRISHEERTVSATLQAPIERLIQLFVETRHAEP